MRHRVSEVQPEKLAQDLKDLEMRSVDELREHWRNLYGTEPPCKIHRSLLIPAIAYRIQGECTGQAQACRPPLPNARRQQSRGWSTGPRLSEPRS
jgi:hypothetical protein